MRNRSTKYIVGQKNEGTILSYNNKKRLEFIKNTIN